MGFETKSVPFFRLKVSTLFVFFRFFLGSPYHEIIVSQEPQMVWGSKLYVHVTGHDRQKRALGFPVRHNASQNKSLQNVFPIFECQMERRYKIQRTPFYYKNWCTGPFFCLNSPRNRGWYQARVHPFSSGNGKGDRWSLECSRDVPCPQLQLRTPFCAASEMVLKFRPQMQGEFLEGKTWNVKPGKEMKCQDWS